MPGRSFQQIWKSMDKERRTKAAAAFMESAEDKNERKAILGVIGTKLNFRPKFAAKLPTERAAAYFASIEGLDELMVGTVIRGYLFGPLQPMLAMFLDELKIEHEKGIIKADEVAAPSAEALAPALEKIRASFDAQDVELYKEALLASDPTTWANLEAKA
jgi:hypothetical protein